MKRLTIPSSASPYLPLCFRIEVSDSFKLVDATIPNRSFSSFDITH